MKRNVAWQKQIWKQGTCKRLSCSTGVSFETDCKIYRKSYRNKTDDKIKHAIICMHFSNLNNDSLWKPRRFQVKWLKRQFCPFLYCTRSEMSLLCLCNRTLSGWISTQDQGHATVTKGIASHTHILVLLCTAVWQMVSNFSAPESLLFLWHLSSKESYGKRTRERL